MTSYVIQVWIPVENLGVARSLGCSGIDEWGATIVRQYQLLQVDRSLYLTRIRETATEMGMYLHEVLNLIHLMQSYPSGPNTLEVHNEFDVPCNAMKFIFTFTQATHTSRVSYYQDEISGAMDRIPVGRFSVYDEVPREAVATFNAAIPKNYPPKRRLILKSIS